MSKKGAMFAAAGKFLKKFMLIYLYKSSFLFFSIPKFNLKSWVIPPLFLKIFPPFGFHDPKIFFQVPPPFFKFSKFGFPPLKGGDTLCDHLVKISAI